MQTIRPASHTTALGGLFIAEVWEEAQGGISVGTMFTELVPRARAGSRGDAGRAALDRTAEGRCPHMNLIFTQLLREFQGYEFGWFLACVGYGVGIVAGEPFGVAGFEVAGHGALAFYVAANV